MAAKRRKKARSPESKPSAPRRKKAKNSASQESEAPSKAPTAPSTSAAATPKPSNVSKGGKASRKKEKTRRGTVYSGDRSIPSPYDGATAERPVSPYFADDSYVTYEGSRIPWWVRVMWIFFWLIALYYAVVLAWPDAQRYF